METGFLILFAIIVSNVPACWNCYRLLGLPVVELNGIGEAEALCSVLNSLNLCDAVITQDGDGRASHYITNFS